MRAKRSRTFQPLTLDRQASLRDLPLASFRARLAAFAIDISVVCLVCGAIEIYLELPDLLLEIGLGAKANVEVNPFHSWSLIILAIYFGLTTYLGHGQTPGKRLLGIRVVSLSHGHLSLWHAVERALGYGASLLEGGFGFMQYFIHPNRQTVHDRIAETIVVKVPKAPKGGPPPTAETPASPHPTAR